MKREGLGGEMLGDNREKKSDNLFWTVVFVVILLFFSFFAVRVYVSKHFSGVVVNGTSMDKTLYDGERLIMRYTDENHKAERGDIIIVYVGDYEECSSVKGGHLIKRLIATEGDRLYCENGQVYVQYAGTAEYVALYEPYAYYGENNGYKMQYDFDTYVVGAGEVFFLGDNRSADGSSMDSRYQEGKSHLQNALYKESDIIGYIPNWALKRQSFLSKLPIW